MDKRTLRMAFRAMGARDDMAAAIRSASVTAKANAQRAETEALCHWLAYWYQKLLTPEDYARAYAEPAFYQAVQLRENILLVVREGAVPVLVRAGWPVARFYFNRIAGQMDEARSRVCLAPDGVYDNRTTGQREEWRLGKLACSIAAKGLAATPQGLPPEAPEKQREGCSEFLKQPWESYPDLPPPPADESGYRRGEEQGKCDQEKAT